MFYSIKRMQRTKEQVKLHQRFRLIDENSTCELGTLKHHKFIMQFSALQAVRF